MGLLNSALHIGRSAVLGYQNALQVVGSNISSAASPDYTRLSPQLDPVHSQLSGIQPGAGVALTGIQRNIDEALEGRLRLAAGDVQSASAQQSIIAQAEQLFDDFNGNGLSSQLTTFFSGFSAVQNDPEDLASRELAITNGVNLADRLTSIHEQLIQLGASADDQIESLVAQADEIAGKIADLNREISTAESNTTAQATALRDQRDGLLRSLAQITHVSVREQPNGVINVYLGSEALVQGTVSRGLMVERNVDGSFQRTSVHFADNGGEVRISGGQLEGLVIGRDQHAYGRVDAINQLAAGLITEVNRLHADGQGLIGYSELTASNPVSDVDAVLAEGAGLPASVTRGSLMISVLDSTSGTPTTFRIDIEDESGDSPTTLSSLVEQINETVFGVTASITDDNRLQFAADGGFSFVFGFDGQGPRSDTSGVLAALGMNTMFTGTDATNIAVNETLLDDPRHLSAASILAPADGSTAGAIAQLETTASSALGNQSVGDFYVRMVSDMATRGAAIADSLDARSAILESLQTQRESISGVNLDEEAISLLKFERSFQGAARYISVVDQLLRELIASL